jgi:hypothetical protein
MGILLLTYHDGHVVVLVQPGVGGSTIRPSKRWD